MSFTVFYEKYVSSLITWAKNGRRNNLAGHAWYGESNRFTKGS